MIIIIALISISLVIAIVFLAFFIWGMKSGQFDDTFGPAVRMLFEDKKRDGQPEKRQHTQKQKYLT